MTKKEKRQIGRVAGNPSSVFGGHRTGKRKKGTSLLKRKPRASAVAVTWMVKDEHGDTVGSIKTLRYTREQ